MAPPAPERAPAAAPVDNRVEVCLRVPAELIEEMIDALRAAQMTAIRRGIAGPGRRR